MTPGVLPAFITSGLIILVTSVIIVNCTNELYSKRLDPHKKQYVPSFTSSRANVLRTFLREVANFLLAVYTAIAVLFLANQLPKLAAQVDDKLAQKLGPIHDALLDQFVIVAFAMSIILATIILRWYIFVRRHEY